MFQYYTSRFNLVQLQTTLCHCSEVERKCWPIKSSDFLYSKKMFLSRRFYILMQISVKYNWPFVREKHGLENLSNAKYALLQTYYLLCEFFSASPCSVDDDTYISNQLSKIYIKHVKRYGRYIHMSNFKIYKFDVSNLIFNWNKLPFAIVSGLHQCIHFLFNHFIAFKILSFLFDIVSVKSNLIFVAKLLVTSFFRRCVKYFVPDTFEALSILYGDHS